MSSTRTLPLLLPGRYVYSGGVTPTSDVDTGGYDFTLGGKGYRFATDQNFPYQWVTEPTTVQRFDSSSQPGEQSLSPLPWAKSQSSFHAGAGQLNLEQGFVAFQYQQEQVEHIRFDNCLGVDVWTPGKVSRLPATLLTNPSRSQTRSMITATSGGVDYAVLGGASSHLYRAIFSGGPDVAPTFSDIDLTGAVFGGASNCSIASLVTDGNSYYALVHLAVAGSIASVRTLVIKGNITDSLAPTVMYKGPADNSQLLGALGWVKARLVAGLANSFYQLDANASGPAALPAATYTHPTTFWQFSSFTESPDAILGAGSIGGQSSILAFTLDSTGAVPTLTGGASVAVLPAGELIYSIYSVLGSFIGIGTTAGIRVGTFDTYTGALHFGPLSVNTTSPVRCLATRDRFLYGGFTNQQADGKTGLVRVDLSFIVDASGRNAYAPDLRPPSTAPTGLGIVYAVSSLALSGRVIFLTDEGVHVEGSAPSADGNAWLRTSRIRYDTTEPKFFKAGRITGTLDSASIGVTGITPFGGATALGTFGPIVGGNPGEFGLPAGTSEWLQLQFSLIGAGCQLSTYSVKSYPAPRRQQIGTLTAQCYVRETDRLGVEAVDPETPRQRWQNALDMENAGIEVRYVEFTPLGPIVKLVLVEQVAFQTTVRPVQADDIGGLLTFKIRSTQ